MIHRIGFFSWELSDFNRCAGVLVPWWLGLAWYRENRMSALFMPIPLNWFAGGFRNFWISLRRPCGDDPVIAAFEEGRARGHHEGYQAAMLHALTDIMGKYNA